MTTPVPIGPSGPTVRRLVVGSQLRRLREAAPGHRVACHFFETLPVPTIIARAGLAVIVVVLGALGYAFTPGPLEDVPALDNPYGLGGVAGAIATARILRGILFENKSDRERGNGKTPIARFRHQRSGIARRHHRARAACGASRCSTRRRPRCR